MKISSNIAVPVIDGKPKVWLKPTDQMDSWLDSQGFYRKHIARDASSLFRCVSELVIMLLYMYRESIKFTVMNLILFALDFSIYFLLYFIAGVPHPSASPECPETLYSVCIKPT